MVIQRLKKAHSRITNVARLSRITRGARKLVPTRAIPLAAWGAEAVGLPPTRIAALRRRAAAGTGLVQARRCATMAIFIAYQTDPEDTIVSNAITSWRRYILPFASDPGHTWDIAKTSSE